MTARRTIIDWLRDRGVEVYEVPDAGDSATGLRVYTAHSGLYQPSVRIWIVGGKFDRAIDDEGREVRTEATVRRWFR